MRESKINEMRRSISEENIDIYYEWKHEGVRIRER
jgi:hypothetical protein